MSVSQDKLTAGATQETTAPEATADTTKKEETPAYTAEDTASASSANTKSYADNIRQQYDAYLSGKQNAIDYQTEYRANQAQREYDDAVSKYKTQYRNLTANMYQGADNQALMSAVNGQRGGMATLGVATTQSEYQKQRQALSLEQQKLATDTAREIEDLRAQGEFDKADALLEARQQEFQQLYNDAVRVDENQYTNWQYENALKREDDAIQLNQKNTETDYARSLGMMFLQKGLLPPDALLNAMGIDKATAQSLINQINLGY